MIPYDIMYDGIIQGGVPMPSDDLEARRWLRELFRKLGAQYPGLKTTEAQERLTAELERQEQEDKSHDEER
jgi:hypothetical protein